MNRKLTKKMLDSLFLFRYQSCSSNHSKNYFAQSNLRWMNKDNFELLIDSVDIKVIYSDRLK